MRLIFVMLLVGSVLAPTGASAGPPAPSIGEVYVQRGKPARAGEQTSAKVSCPKGREVLSGGVVVSGTSIALTVASNGPADGDDADRKLDDAWKGAINNGTTTGESMAVYAQCAAKADSRYIKHITESFDLAPGAVGSPKIICELPMLITGGGLVVSGGGMKAPIQNTMPFDEAIDPDLDRDNSWVTRAQNNSTKKIRVTMTGVCADPNALGERGGDVVSAEANGGAGAMTKGQGTMTCPAGHLALGGGVGEANILGSFVTVASIRPDQPTSNGWSGFLNNHHPTSAMSFKVAAVCIRPF